MDAYMVFIL